MHFSFLAEYWWLILAAMLAVMVVFILVAGRSAEGGMSGRTRLGWSKWMAVSKKAAEVQARVILSLFYFTLAAPFGLARTHLADALRLKKVNQPRRWLERETRDLTLDDARKQF